MARDFVPDNYLSLGDVAAIDLSGATDLTLAAWVFIDTLTSNRPVIQKGTNVLSAYTLNVGSSATPGFSIGGGGTTQGVSGPATFPTGVWTHIAGARRGARMDCYVNGVSVGNRTDATVSMDNIAEELRIGSRVSSVANMDGRIGEAAIWNVGLSAEEVKALAMGVSPLTVRPGPNLRGYWPIIGAGSPEIDLSEWRTNAVIAASLPAANHCPSGPYLIPG